MLHVTAPVRESRYASQSGDHSHWRRLRFKTWRIVVNVLRPTVRGGSLSGVLTTLTPRCCACSITTPANIIIHTITIGVLGEVIPSSDRFRGTQV